MNNQTFDLIFVAIIVSIIGILFGPGIIYYFHQSWQSTYCGWGGNISQAYYCAYPLNITNAKSYELVLNQIYTTQCTVSHNGINCQDKSPSQLTSYSNPKNTPFGPTYAQVAVSHGFTYGQFKYMVNWDDGSNYTIYTGYYCTGGIWSYWTCLGHLN